MNGSADDDFGLTPLDRFERGAREAAVRVGPQGLRVLADLFDSQRPLSGIRASLPGFEDETAALIAASRQEDLPAQAVAAYLRGVAAAQEQAAVQVESVWSGPTSHAVPVRATAQVLSQLVARARHELLLMTYSARPTSRYGTRSTRPSREVSWCGSWWRRCRELGRALRRGARRRLPRAPPGAVALARRAAADDKGRMHAKIAVADRRELLVSSANLTQSGVNSNIEAGLLVRGGTAPERAAEHFDALRSTGLLERL